MSPSAASHEPRHGTLASTSKQQTHEPGRSGRARADGYFNRHANGIDRARCPRARRLDRGQDIGRGANDSGIDVRHAEHMAHVNSQGEKGWKEKCW